MTLEVIESIRFGLVYFSQMCEANKLLDVGKGLCKYDVSIERGEGRGPTNADKWVTSPFAFFPYAL